MLSNRKKDIKKRLYIVLLSLLTSVICFCYAHFLNLTIKFLFLTVSHYNKCFLYCVT